MGEQCSKLIQLLGSADLQIRRRAIRALENKARLECVTWALTNDSVPNSTKELICHLLCRTRWLEAVPALLSQLHSEDAGLRAVAIDALGDVGDQTSGPHLLRLLEDPNQPTPVRDTAASALGAIGYHPAWQELARQLTDPAETVRYCAAKSLGMLAETAAIPALETALRTELKPSIRDQIVQALGKLRESNSR